MVFVKIQGPQERTLKFKVRQTAGVVSPLVTDEIVLREAFVENTYGLHPDHFAHTGIMIDIGANIGAVAVLATGLGAKRVIAYEPEPENYALLMDNVARNLYPDTTIETHRQAVWSTEAMIELVPSQGATTSHPVALDLFRRHVIQVPSVTLAYVLQPFDEVDVLKVDTEGAEYEIFRDRALNQKVRVLMMEYHTTTTERFGALVALLSLTHNLQVFGHYDTDGGQILGKRYGD